VQGKERADHCDASAADRRTMIFRSGFKPRMSRAAAREMIAIKWAYREQLVALRAQWSQKSQRFDLAGEKPQSPAMPGMT
jgi:hypothetical protein